MHARKLFLPALITAALLPVASAQAATSRSAEHAVARMIGARYLFDSVYAKCRKLGRDRFECRVDAYRLEADSAYTARGYAVRSARRWAVRMPKPRRCGCLDTF